jgi:hypothetical protein
LVLASDEIDSTDGEERARLREALFRIALEIRDSKDESREPVLWAAIRRFASLVPVGEAHRLLEFTREGCSTRTQQTVMQGFQEIFTHASPKELATCRGLGLPISKVMGGLKIPAGPDAETTLALNAYHALAALGDERLTGWTETIVRSRQRWLINVALRRLKQVLESRDSAGLEHRQSSSDVLTRNLATISGSSE